MQAAAILAGNEVRPAGKRLGQPIVGFEHMSKAEKDELYRVFSVANDWRESHVYPMRSVRQSVIARMRTLGCNGITAGRVKRMAAIRRKLSTTPIHLDQIQDIAGCRAILDNMDGVRKLVASISDEFPHNIRRQSPYIDAPKDDGYRSHHFALDFEKGERRRVELQVRTRLQHSWATAVEAVGLFLGQDIKHHKGDVNWLRLFQLMSGEFARVEGGAGPQGMPSRSDCLKELRELDHVLGAAQLLDNIKILAHYAENYDYDKGQFYVIRYRRVEKTVDVTSFSSESDASTMVSAIERLVETGQDDSRVVMVEVDRMDGLVETYPNYFGDVSLFVQNLKQICLGKDAIEYHMAPQKLVKPKPEEKPDPTSLFRRYTRWNDPSRK